MMCMESIIAILIPDVKPDGDATGKSNGQPADVNERVTFIPHEIAQSNFNIVSYHSRTSQVTVVSFQDMCQLPNGFQYPSSANDALLYGRMRIILFEYGRSFYVAA